MSTSGMVRQGCAGRLPDALGGHRLLALLRRRRQAAAAVIASSTSRLKVLDHLDRLSGVSLPWARSLIMTTGAMPQAPTQCTSSTVYSMSGVFSPAWMPRCFSTSSRDERGARHVAGRAVAAADGVLRVGLEPELRIEGGDAQSLAERLAGRLGHPGHHVFRQVSEDRLRPLQKGDQRPRLSLCSDPAAPVNCSSSSSSPSSHPSLSLVIDMVLRGSELL